MCFLRRFTERAFFRPEEHVVCPRTGCLEPCASFGAEYEGQGIMIEDPQVRPAAAAGMPTLCDSALWRPANPFT
jgi:hypothetical protein